jgi:hypothetical protein
VGGGGLVLTGTAVDAEPHGDRQGAGREGEVAEPLGEVGGSRPSTKRLLTAKLTWTYFYSSTWLGRSGWYRPAS